MTLKKRSNLGFLKIYSNLEDWLEIFRDPSDQPERPRVKLCTSSQTKSIHLTKDLKWEVSNKKIGKDPINTSMGKKEGSLENIIARMPQHQIPTDPITLGQLNSCPFHFCPVVISK